MDKNSLKLNILRECYYHPNMYVGKESFRLFTDNEPLLTECCSELVGAGYLLCKDCGYLITEYGIEVFESYNNGQQLF